VILIAMPDAKVTPGMNRAVRGLLGGLMFAIASPVLLCVSMYAGAFVILGGPSQMAGYLVIALAVVGAPAGAVVGLVLSTFGPVETWRRRCLCAAVALVVAGMVLALALVKR
jgi:hypothetical protein